MLSHATADQAHENVEEVDPKNSGRNTEDGNMYEGYVLYKWQGQDSSDKSVQCEIPEEVVSVVPCKEVALRRVVPQAEISHLNRQYGHLCPLFNNDKK